MSFIDDLGRGGTEGKIRDLTQRVDSLEAYGNNALAIIAAGAVPGSSGTLAVGTVTTGSPDSPATVTNVGTPNAAVFDISLPRGPSGPTGFAPFSADEIVSLRALLSPPFSSNALFINDAGQSRAAGNTQSLAMSTVQVGKARAYPFAVASPTQSYPLQGDNPLLTNAAGIKGDFPSIGTWEFIYELLAKENGITAARTGMLPFTACNALGSTAISANNKGTPRYNQSVAQVSRMAVEAAAAGLAPLALGTVWAQGEADTGHTTGGVPDSFSYYKTALQALANDFKTDWRAQLPGQPPTLVPHLVSCSVDSSGPGNDRFGVTRAILQAAIDFSTGTSSAPVGFSTPTYFMDYRSDPSGVHLRARDAKWLGAYAGLYFKRVFFDKVSWVPMAPSLVSVSGGAILVKLNMRATGTQLVIAETLDVNQTYNAKALYQQPGRGWSGVDTSGNPITFTELPTVVGIDTIRLVPSVAPALVARLDYAQQPAIGMYPFGERNGTGPATGTGNLYNTSGPGNMAGAGNFRDNYGDTVKYIGANGPASAVNRRMDNWLPPLSILPAANAAGFTWPTS